MHFFPGKAVRAIADHYARLRKHLQHKGTRSATQRMIAIAGRERRLKQDRNHIISRQIVTAYPHSLIGLEDLTHIRERSKRQHGKHGKKATVMNPMAKARGLQLPRNDKGAASGCMTAARQDRSPAACAPSGAWVRTRGLNPSVDAKHFPLATFPASNPQCSVFKVLSNRSLCS